MKQIPILLFLLLQGFLLKAQPKLQFDTTSFDLGEIFVDTEIMREIRFTNIGTEPLTIWKMSFENDIKSARVEYTGGPVAPGKIGVINLYFNSKGYFRDFRLTLNVYTDPKKKYYGYLKTAVLKGRVVWPKTTIQTDSFVKDLGTIPFGEVDSVQFELRNSGKEKLHFDLLSYRYNDQVDMLYCEVRSKDSLGKWSKGAWDPIAYYPNETVLVKIVFKNLYGNSGAFERKFQCSTNTKDTLVLMVKGNYTGIPSKTKVFEDGYVLFYENGKLVKRGYYTDKGQLKFREFYEGSYRISKK